MLHTSSTRIVISSTRVYKDGLRPESVNCSSFSMYLANCTSEWEGAGIHCPLPRFLNAAHLTLDFLTHTEVFLNLWNTVSNILLIRPCIIHNAFHLNQQVLVSALLQQCIASYLKHRIPLGRKVRGIILPVRVRPNI